MHVLLFHLYNLLLIRIMQGEDILLTQRILLLEMLEEDILLTHVSASTYQNNARGRYPAIGQLIRSHIRITQEEDILLTQSLIRSLIRHREDIRILQTHEQHIRSSRTIKIRIHTNRTIRTRIRSTELSEPISVPPELSEPIPVPAELSEPIPVPTTISESSATLGWCVTTTVPATPIS